MSVLQLFTAEYMARDDMLARRRQRLDWTGLNVPECFHWTADRLEKMEAMSLRRRRCRLSPADPQQLTVHCQLLSYLLSTN